MKIYSKFKDYYDSALSSFYSEDIVYDRRQETLEHQHIPELDNFVWDYNEKNPGKRCYWSKAVKLIGFCGKWYYVPIQDWGKPIGPILTLDELNENNEKNGLFGDMTDNQKEKMCKSSAFYNIESGKMNGTETQDNGLFLKYKSPILEIDYETKPLPFFSQRGVYKVKTNPELKQYGFAKKIDPYTAMQELEMYIGNVLTNNESPKMPVGTDDEIRDSKGFDKYSFRKAKQKV